MEDKTSIPRVPSSKTAGQVQDAANTTGTKSQMEAPKEHGGESLEAATQAADRVVGTQATPEAKVQEHRQAYGTAKTENLRDSGAWRILLPTFVVLCCLAILAIPLIILVPLLYGSLNPRAASNMVAHVPLVWVWIVMTIIEVGLAVVIGYGLLRIFITQAGNYRR
ncbi:MAG: hypothetical protein NVS4B11_23780 [Ktedonobacteraceae bacterium]